MRILLTGATGFIGRALIPVLLSQGHSLVAWTRSATRVRDVIGADIDTLSESRGHAPLISELSRCDGIVNLAGERIIGNRWTRERRAKLRASRIDLTDRLVGASAAAFPRPKVLISASAVGYYGHRGSQALTEGTGVGSGFLANLSARWEAAAQVAEPLGMRVVRLRMGIVLGREGGALAQLLPFFRLGLGGPLGSGRQYVPWIHLHDVIRVVAMALRDERYCGAVNLVAPEEVTSRMFGKAIGEAVGRPAFLPVPSVALRVIFGESAEALLNSHRVLPIVLKSLGFKFRFSKLPEALGEIVYGD